MNRFYQPSSPRYTSQFVENPLPMDLMMKAGEQKYNQQMQFAQTVGEMSALNDNLTPGYRTEKIAPKVISYWDNKINETVQKIGSNYDSPQAIMELSRLHSAWAGDPRVQLIKYDREIGNKEWDKMLEKTDTYMTDINKNIDPQTGTLIQFGESDSYKPYTPLIKTQDTFKHWIDELKTIEPTITEHPEISTVDVGGVSHVMKRDVRIETRDPNMLMEKAIDITKRIMNPTDQFSLYHKENLARQLGHEPSEQEILTDIMPIIKAAQVNKQTGGTSLSTQPEWAQNNMSKTGQSLQETEISKHPKLLNGAIKSELKQAKLDTRFGKYPSFTDAINHDWVLKSVYSQLSHKPEFANLDDSEKKKAMNNFVNDELDKPITYDYMKPNPKEWVALNQKYSGLNNKEGFIPEKEHGTSQILIGSTVWDIRNGEVIQSISQKEGLTKGGNTFSVNGPVADKDIAKQPHPGLYIFEAGPKGSEGLYGIVDKDLYNKQRDIWNWLGYQRETITKTSPVFAIDINNKSGSITYHDVTEPGTNGNDMNVHGGQNALYFITREDPNDGKIKVDVYSRNPKNPEGTLTEKDHIPDIGLNDSNNKYFLKEYDATDAGGIEPIQHQITSEINTLFTIRDKKLFSTNNQ